MTNNMITDELLAAFLDGNTTEAETRQVLRAIRKDPELQETMDIVLLMERKKKPPRFANAANDQGTRFTTAKDQKEQRKIAKKTATRQPKKVMNEM